MSAVALVPRLIFKTISEKAGGRSALQADLGFTLLELIVALTLITIMLFITVPRLPDNPFIDHKRKTSAWIMGKVQALKEEAVIRAKDHTLHIEMDTGRLWIAHEFMTVDQMAVARKEGHLLPEGALIDGVEFPNGDKQTTGQARIWFSKEGYSQMALIHTGFSDGTQRSFLVEPFLQKVKVYDEPISFSQ